MGSPINSFEIVESIRFFAALVGTDGVCQAAKDKANEYVLQLVNCLQKSVDETSALMSGLTLVN